MNLKQLLSLLLVICMVSSCNLNSTFEDDVDFKEGFWHMDSLAVFNFESTKSTQNIEVKLRNNLEYPFYNFYLKMELMDSIGGPIEDTLISFNLYNDKTGKPIGKGNSIYQLNTIALPAYPFPYDGAYQIRLAQYMRKTALPGILSAGVRIVPAKD